MPSRQAISTPSNWPEVKIVAAWLTGLWPSAHSVRILARKSGGRWSEWPWLRSATYWSNGLSSRWACRQLITRVTAVLATVARANGHQVLVVRSLNSSARIKRVITGYLPFPG